ncbi:hypothetical protein SNE40_004389 [Patella caerulea]|uniref:Cytochrome P450 n=1 Tax=Patella caerulea TaxID=87958 RepID=A0AAN8PY10_PATCE
MGLILISSVVLLVTFLIIKWFKDQQKTPLPPGPGLLECLKITWHMMRKNDTHLIGEELSRRYGDIFIIRILSVNTVFLNSSRIMRKVFSTSQYRDVTNDRPPTFFSEYIFYGGKDLTLRNNDDLLVKIRHIIHRSMKMYGDGVKVFEDMVNSEIELMKNTLQSADNEPTFDLDSALTVSIIRILHIFLTNETPDNAAEICSVIKEYDHFANVLFNFSNNMVLTLFPWLRCVPGPFRDMYKKMKNVQNRLHDLYLNDRIKKRLGSHGKGVLAHILAEFEVDDQLNEFYVKSVLGNLVVAGYLTTKGALSGFFLLMLYYPEVQRRIQEEIDENIGKERIPSLDDRPVMHYTNACILECLRFIGHVPFAVPHRNKIEVEIEGLRIPANSTLIPNMWTMTHSDKAWDRHDEFLPERFLGDDGKLLPVDHPLRSRLIPFGTGRRVCVGESFAKSRIFLFVTLLLQKFNFSPDKNKLAPLHSSLWKPEAVLHPDFLKCAVRIR